MKFVPLPGSHAYRTLLTVVAPLMAPMLYLAAAWGQPAKAGVNLPVLTRVSEIRQLTRDQAARGYPIHIRAVVTYYSPTGPNFLGRDTYMSSDTPDLFVQDSTAGIWVNLPKGSPALHAGQLVEMGGVTEVPDFAPQIGKPHYRVVGEAPLPQPKQPTLERMLSSVEDSQWVQTPGIVRQVKLEHGMLSLDVAVPGGRLKAIIPGFHDAAPGQLVDADVQVRGACGAVFNKKLQLVSILLYVPSLKQIEVLKPPQDPFAQNVRPVDTVAHFAPEGSMGHRIRIQGVVTLQDSGRIVYLSDGKTGLRVESTEPVDFRPGDRLDVAGFLRVSDYTLAVEDAVCRRIGTQTPLPPRPVTLEQVLSGEYDFLPVSIEGHLLERSILGDSQTLVLKNGHAVFSALIRQPHSAGKLTARANSLLRVSGICVTDRDQDEQDQAFRVLLQSTADVTVLQEPPWWTVPKALVVISAFGLFILIGLAWFADMQRRAAAQKSRQQLLDLTANLPGVVFQFQTMEMTVGKFLFISEGLEKLCGRTAQEVMANAFLLPESVYPEDARAVWNELRRAWGTRTTFVCTYRVKRGEQLRWLSATAVPLAQHSDHILWNGVIMDVTPVKEAEIKLAKYAEELTHVAAQAEAGAKVKSEFLATMSHEIRTPINGVIGMTSLLLETPLSAEQRDWADTIRSSGEALLCVINDVLDFSKIEAGKLDLESHPFELRSLLEESLELVAAMAHRKKLEICAVVEDDVSPFVAGDPARLRQILLNLLGNAIKFTEAGEVVLSAQREEESGDTERIRFSVRDTGIGITEDVKARLFQSFSQADSSTTRRYGGTGLGLAISKRLVNLMGGEIGVDSVTGQGSTFWFSVPLKKMENIPAGASLESLRGKRALVVDDSRTNRNILDKQLSGAGMKVTVTADGNKALALLEDAARQGQPFDLGVLDLHMPAMNGLMLTREIRSREAIRALPLLILTSDRDPDEAAEASEMGVGSFLVKPVRQGTLLKAIAQAFGEIRAPEQSAPEAAPRKLQGRVLVAEDNATNQKVIVMRLARLGCRVDVANDGLEATEAASKTAYDLILMDCQMPVMDGFQATRAIRKQGGRRVPIVALTANAMEGERERCLGAGMDDYLAKPVRPDDLVAKLERWLSNGRAPSTEPAEDPAVCRLRDQFHTFVAEMDDGQTSSEEIESLLSIVLETTPPMMLRLAESIERREAEEAAFAAHSLKGTFATMRLLVLAEAVGSVEQDCKDLRWENGAENMVPVKRLFHEVALSIASCSDGRLAKAPQ